MKFKRGDLLKYIKFPRNYRRVKEITSVGGMRGYRVVGVDKNNFKKESKESMFFSKLYMETNYILIKRVNKKVRRIE
jgi:hypothetical protein